MEASVIVAAFLIRCWCSIHSPNAFHRFWSCHPHGRFAAAGKNDGSVAVTLASWSFVVSDGLARTSASTPACGSARTAW